MNQRERQQKEIATIKERTLTIKLSDADVLKWYEEYKKLKGEADE